MAWPVDVLASLALAAAFAWVLAAFGRRLRGLSGLDLEPALAWPFDVLAGAWAWSLLALLLGLLGGFRALTLATLAGSLAALGRHRAPGLPRPAWLLAAPAVLLLPVALAPPFFYDAHVYHLGLPWQALVAGRIEAHPENVFAAFPPLAQLVYALPLSLGVERATGALHLIVTLAAGAGLAGWALRLGAPGPCAWAGALAFVLLPTVAFVSALPAAECWLLAGIVTALALAGGVGGAGQDRLAAAAGFAIGVGAAARLQGLSWSAIVLAAVALLARASRPLGLAAAGTALGAAPWWLKNLILLGEPLAPVGWRREGLETLWRDSVAHAALGTPPLAALRQSFGDLAPFLPWLAPLVLAALLEIVARGGRTWATAASVPLGFGAWVATGALPRFLAPTLAVVVVLAAASTAARSGRIAGGLALGGALAFGLLAAWRDVGRAGGVALLGPAAGERAAALVPTNPSAAYAAARELPEDARILLVGDARGFRLPRRFAVTSQHDPTPLRDLLEDNRTTGGALLALRSRGFTHLLVNHAELRRLAPGYPVAPWRTERGRERFGELLCSLGRPAVSAGPVAIFDLAAAD